MASRRSKTLLSIAIFIGVLTWNIAAAAAVKGETAVPVGALSVHDIEEQLQVRSESIPIPIQLQL